jgi:hypothetical protein
MVFYTVYFFFLSFYSENAFLLATTMRRSQEKKRTCNIQPSCPKENGTMVSQSCVAGELEPKTWFLKQLGWVPQATTPIMHFSAQNMIPWAT